ncbi:anthranilate phosphoribosyltransferase [Tardibacter chloracetimidivorans]|uniref:Anthranilate phosphoribosyltransferase n=1 Tax=Tardibacter chloracetimidivorans TaxID=1921510 RepID=A0A1L3ZRA6_9SPHN|nr:anthranilate phosphoribosyltransferase [Tardibacter chloracetimidivorans]API58161.1 anthranilate phosphoribosyltransferase [Tardibacter chloracetimidivorans]
MLPDVTQPLSREAAADAFAAILDGKYPDEEVGPFLVALNDRGETADEIAAAAREMRARMVAIEAPADAIDVCGTGGDGSHSLNVSTAVALVVAAAGTPVAKHGNRAASSRAGAADTLEALGLDLDIAEKTAERSLAELGIAFLFAARHHPALGRLGPLRRALGRRTIFNLLGPLCNPAGVRRQLIGVPSPAYVETHIAALKTLGAERAMAVHGEEGLDEISICGPSRIATLSGGDIARDRITPEAAGLPAHNRDAIRGGDAAFNAQALRKLLAGERSAYRDAVLMNAAGALIVADAAGTWHDGAERAAEAIDSGRAAALLDRWIAFR